MSQIELGETNFRPREGGGGSGPVSQVGLRKAARAIVRSHGVAGLFAGLAPRLLKVAPACAIMISTYEYCKLFFRRWNNRWDDGDGKGRRGGGTTE